VDPAASGGEMRRAQSLPIRLLFLDMEGTLFAKQRVRLHEGEERVHHSLWSRIAHELGPEVLEEDRQTVEKWESGGYRSYTDWCDQSLRLHQRHGITRDFFESVAASIPYNPGVQETLTALHDRGLMTAIVSGGFMAQARRAQRELKLTHAFAAADLFWDDRGHLVHWNIFPCDYAGKVDLVRLLIRDHRLELEECAFVGDGKNDVLIAREVGLSFAYQAHPELQRAATHSIDDFTELLRYL
jgi:phosphoserine phosphatase